LLKNLMVGLVLDGAALQRRGGRVDSNAALAAEVGISDRLLVLPRLSRPSLAVIALALFSSFAFAESGADIYKTRCSACHGAHGTGDTMIGKNLALRPLGSPEVQEQSDDQLATIIGKGKNRMPAFDRKLSPEQIGEVVKYLRMLKQ
jgi:cytochrome c5